MQGQSIASPATAAISQQVRLPRSTPYFAAFVLVLLARIYIPASLLDEMFSYDRSGGTIFEKFHPGAIAIALLFALMLATVGWLPRVREPKIIRSSILLVGGCILTGAVQVYYGRTSGLAYLADSVIVGPLVAAMMLTLTNRERINVGLFILAALVVNDMILFIEFATSTRLLPYAEPEPFFRPTALLNHPLANGLVNATAVVYVLTLPLPARMRLFLMLMFVGACFASGARFATIASVLGAVIAIWTMLHERSRRLKISAKLVVIVFVQIAVVLGVLVYILLALGLAKRMLLLGFHDSSTESRFTAFYILELFPVRDLMIGADPRSLATVMNVGLGIQTIENPVVAMITQFGIIGCAIILPLLTYFLLTLARCNNRLILLAVVVFVITGSTNNTFAAKGPTIALIAALAMSARRSGSAAEIAAAPRYSALIGKT
ncbi:MAG TPA: VpsF family polysaccharide biosynthesis protein [Rhizomicrobium sp.]